MNKKFVLFLLFLFSLNFSISQSKSQFYTLDEALKLHPDSVKKLTLKKYKLDSIPIEILRFTKLTYLDLSFNKLTNLPPFLINFSNLQELDFSKNSFTNFPTVICELSSLKALKFNRNAITSIDSCIQNLQKLEYLDFWDNPIKFFPEVFIQLRNLKEIHAEGIRYSPKFQEKWITNLPKVKFFFDAPCDCVD